MASAPVHSGRSEMIQCGWLICTIAPRMILEHVGILTGLSVDKSLRCMVYWHGNPPRIASGYDAVGRMNKGVGNAYGVDTCVLNNPFTYRGYYYDVETECYYASSH